MGPKTPYDTEKLPPGIMTIISVIFGAIFLVGLFELSLHYPNRDSNVLGATTTTITTLEVLFVALLILLGIITYCCIKIFKAKK